MLQQTTDAWFSEFNSIRTKNGSDAESAEMECKSSYIIIYNWIDIFFNFNIAYSYSFTLQWPLLKVWQQHVLQPLDYPNLCISCEIQKAIFLWRQQSCSSFMVDLAMGCYHEHSTMVRGSICKSWFFRLRTIKIIVRP